jgi:hypothetical protein
MANRKAILQQLADYFADKGQMMSPVEYKAATDAPIRYMIAKRPFGSWSRMQGMIKANFPEQWEIATREAPQKPAVKAAAPKKAKAKVAPKKAKK